MQSVLEEISIRGLASEDRLDLWARVYKSCFLADYVWLPPEHQDTFDASMRRRWIDDMLLVEVEADPFCGRWSDRSPANDYIGLQVTEPGYQERILLRGSNEPHIDDTPFNIWDGAGIQQFELLGPFKALILLIPKAALSEVKGGMLALPAIINNHDTPPVRLLMNLISALNEESGVINEMATLAARSAILELMLAASTTEVPESRAAVSDTMRNNILHWVDKHLHLGEISPAEAAAAHGISVRSVHRLFSGSSNSFGSIVRVRRLARARRDIVATSDSIQTIATRWGYADASHFCREFKRAYQLTPSDFRLAHRMLNSDDHELAEVDSNVAYLWTESAATDSV